MIPCGWRSPDFCQPIACDDELKFRFKWDRTGAEYPVVNIRDLDDDLLWSFTTLPTPIVGYDDWWEIDIVLSPWCDGTDCFSPPDGRCFRFSIESVTNVLTDGDNGTFESGTLDGFGTGTGNSVAISTVQARTGTYSALVTAATSLTGNRVWLQSTQMIEFQPCDTYTFKAYIWLPLGNEVLDGVCYSGGGACAGSCSPAINLNVTDGTQGVDYTIDAITGWSYCPATPTNRNVWYEINITVTAIQAFSSRVSIRSGNDDRRRANGIMYVDDITVVPEFTGIIEARSEKFCFYNASDCTNLAEYSNTVSAYSNPENYTTQLRLPMQPETAIIKEDREIFRFSTGDTQVQWEDTQTGRMLRTAWIPPYLQQIFKQAIGSNSFIIYDATNGNAVYFVQNSDYELIDAERYYLQMATVEVVLASELKRLALCGLGSCIAPSNLYASAVGVGGFTLNWDDITGVTGWEVRYRVRGTTSWTVTTTAVNSKAIAGLVTATVYELQVRTECDTDVFSMWTMSYFVKTD